MHRSIRLALALAVCPSLAAANPVTSLGLTQASDSAGNVTAGRLVRSLIEYTRWPVRADPVTICLVGPATWNGALDVTALGDGRRVSRKIVSAAQAVSSGCNVVYTGRIELRAAQQIFASVRGKGVLTIAENDPQCRSQAMFCLLPGRQGLSFAVNIDAVSRSGLRIDPRVLRMASGSMR